MAANEPLDVGTIYRNGPVPDEYRAYDTTPQPLNDYVKERDELRRYDDLKRQDDRPEPGSPVPEAPTPQPGNKIAFLRQALEDDHKIQFLSKALEKEPDDFDYTGGVIAEGLKGAYHTIKQFMDTGSPEASANVALMFGILGLPMAKPGSLGVFGGKGIEGGKSIQGRTIDEISDVLVNSLKNKKPVPKDIQEAFLEFKDSVQKAEKEIQELFPKLTDKDLEHIGMSRPDWETWMLGHESIDNGPRLKTIVGGKKVEPPVKEPPSFPSLDKINKELKAAQDDFARSKHALLKEPNPQYEELVRHKGMLYDRYKNLQDTLKIIEKEKKNDIRGATPIAEALRGRVEFFRDQIAELKYKLSKFDADPTSVGAAKTPKEDIHYMTAEQMNRDKETLKSLYDEKAMWERHMALPYKTKEEVEKLKETIKDVDRSIRRHLKESAEDKGRTLQ